MKKEVFETLKNSEQTRNFLRAQQPKVVDKLKKEFINLGILFIIFLIIFKILFYKENLIVVFRTVLSIFWIFVLPGYFIMIYWSEKLEFLERLIIGVALSAAVIGISSYYIGLIGLNIKYHGIVLPLILISAGVFINFKRFNNKD